MKTVCLARLTIITLLLVCSFSAEIGAAQRLQDESAPPAVGSSFLNAPAQCQDETCPLPVVNDQNQPVYAVVSPVGFHAVEPIVQAPRLNSLAGKRIALTGGSFMAATTHDELKRLIEEEFPTAKVYMFQDVGVGGPYSVFGQTAQTKAFQSRLKELGIDAVISGNCGCGLCTVKESGSAIAAEYIGIPAVAIGAPTFIAQIRSTGVNRGVPALRTAEYPGAFASHSEEELRRNTRETLWPQIKDALTRPVDQAEIDEYAASGRRPFNDVVFTGTYDEVQEFFLANRQTDGLPIVPPTDALVREYLRFTPCDPSDILGVYAPGYRECSVYTAVVNAVMAGVPKELTPVCVALTQALGDGEWRRPLASTHGWTPNAWLNGPLARQLGVDCGQGMISESKNKALGRFLELAMLNLGGYYVKENRMGTFGYLTPFIFAEDEEACLRAGWAPYHVERGRKINDNVVTAASALAWGNNVTPATDDPRRIMELIAFDVTEKQQNGLGNTNPQVPRTVIVTEPVATALAKEYRDKETLEDALIETARRPLSMRAYANYWANTGSSQTDRYSFDEYRQKLRRDPKERVALTKTPEWLRGATDRDQIETIATMIKGQTAILVAGDAARNKFLTLPGGGCASFDVRLPENWNELVAPLGYEPLERFFLTSQEKNADAASIQENTKSTANDAPGVIVAPENLADGEYRLARSIDFVTDAGLLCHDGNGAASAWSYGADAPEILETTDSFAELLANLQPGSSLTVRDGRVVSIVLRPATGGQRNRNAVFRLPEDKLDALDVVVAVVTRRSKREGQTTPDGATLVVSARLVNFRLALGGSPTLAQGAASQFLTLDGDAAALNPGAPVGATAKVGTQNADGTWRTLTFTKRDRRLVEIRYQAAEQLR